MKEQDKTKLKQMIQKAQVASKDAYRMQRRASELKTRIWNELVELGVENTDDFGFDVNARIEIPIRELVDVEALRKLVPDDLFMKCVTATKTEVEKNCGIAVLEQCLDAVEQKPTLKIK